MNNDILDEIVEIEYLGLRETIDINTSGNRLFYANGILTHNSAVEEVEFDHSHISGGISKINTADNVFGIFTSRAMRERGKYQIQCMKSRSSTGVGLKIDLDYNIETMRITDPGINESEESQYKSAASSVMEKIKANAIVEKTENMAVSKVSAESTKLKQMLSSLKSSQT